MTDQRSLWFVRALALAFFAIVVGLLLAGCLPNNPQITLEDIQENKLYAGYHGDTPSPTGDPTLPEYFRVHFDNEIGNRMIWLNGNTIGDRLTYEPGTAYIRFDELKDDLREGKNIVVLDPDRLFQTRTVNFRLDHRGPKFQAVNTCLSGDTGCSVSPGMVHVELKVDDASPVNNVSVNNTPATLDEDTGLYVVQTSNSPANNLFLVRGTDEHGQTNTTQYLKNGVEIQNLFAARIKDSTIQGLKPLIEERANAHPIRIPDENGHDPTQLIGKVLANDEAGGLADVRYVRINELRLRNMRFGKMDFKAPQAGQTGRVDLDIEMYPSVPWVRDNDEVSGNENEVGTYVRTTTWRRCLANCWFGCAVGTRDDNPANNGDGTRLCRSDANMLIESVDIVGEVDFGVQNSNFHLSLGDAVNVNLMDTEGVGEGIGGLAASFKDWAIMKNIMKGIIQGVLNTNLQQIRLGANFENEKGHSFDLVTRANAVATGNGYMDMFYNGKLEIVNAPPNLVRSLGSLYEPSVPIGYVGDNSSNLYVNVNTNIVNQGFDTLYSIGMTHFTIRFKDGSVNFGPDAKADFETDGYERVLELIPSGPGHIIMHGTNEDQATLQYRNATMRIMDYEDGEWKLKFFANADINGGVSMRAADKVMKITINQALRMDVNEVTQIEPIISLPWLSVDVPDETLIGIIKFGFDYLYPFLSGSELTIDIPDIETDEFRSEVTTDAFETRNGHLKFSMSINPQIN